MTFSLSFAGLIERFTVRKKMNVSLLIFCCKEDVVGFDKLLYSKYKLDGIFRIFIISFSINNPTFASVLHLKLYCINESS